MVLKARAVLGDAVVVGGLIESAAVARAREVIPSWEEGVWRILVRAGLRRPRRPVDVNILGCRRSHSTFLVGVDYGEGLVVAMRWRLRVERYDRAHVDRRLMFHRHGLLASNGSDAVPCSPFPSALRVVLDPGASPLGRSVRWWARWRSLLSMRVQRGEIAG